MSQRPQILKVEWWPIDKLKANSWNPNVMDEETMRLTRLSMTEEGFSDPIDVDPDGTILDGEHRWLIAKELGLKEIPVFVKNRAGDDAVITTIRKDRTHGTPDLVKLSEIVGDLVDNLGSDEVHRRLGYDKSEQEALMDVSRWDWGAFGVEEEDEGGYRKAEEITWSVACSSATRDWVLANLARYGGDTELEQFMALVNDARLRAGIPDSEPDDAD